MNRRETLKGMAAATAAAVTMDFGQRAQAQSARRILTIVSQVEATDYDPHVSTGYAPAMLLRNTYDSLVRVEGAPPKIIPHLAESWTVSSDGREYIFKLDPRAKFHDGSPVTAEAVEYSFARLLRINRGNAWMLAGVLDKDSVKAVDAHTVRMTLVNPFAAFLQVLPWMWVVNHKIVEANKGSDDGQTFLRKNLASSGKFRLRRVEPGNLTEFERVADYWKGGGNLTGAIWKVTRETSSQRLALASAQAHMAVDLNTEDMDALKGQPGVVLVMEPEFRSFTLKMNTQHGPLADVNMRRAVSYAYNYQAMLDAAGPAELMRGPLPNGMFGFDPKIRAYGTDLDKAREYLSKSKNPNGGFTLRAPYVSGLESQRRYALILLDSLKKLNIDVEVKAMPWVELSASTKSPQTAPDFFPLYQTSNYADPDSSLFAGYHGSRNGNWSNPTYSNPRVNELLSAARVEVNEAKRVALYQEIQQLIVDDAADLFGVLEKRKLAMRSDVKGFVFTPIASNSVDLFALSLA